MTQPTISGQLQQKVNQIIYDKYKDRRKNDLAKVLSTEEGRRFLFGILHATNFQGQITVDNASKRDYLLGRRSVSVDIYEMIKQPENADVLYPLFEQMLREDISLQNEEEAEKKRLVESFLKKE